MAVVSIIPYAYRLDDCDTDSTGSWASFGGGGTGAYVVDTELKYQGVAAISKAMVNTGFRGVGATYSPTIDVSGTEPSSSVWLAKFYVTAPGAVLTRTSPGLTLRIGDSSTVYNEYYVEGSDTYPAIGGWRFIPIDPNISEYINAATEGTVSGTPNFTTMGYVAIANQFAVQVKGTENTAIDAIDFGKGLNLVGGDGGDTDGNFRDFVEFDGDTVANRYGFAYPIGTSIIVNGTLTIGEETGSAQTAVATEFTTTGDVVLFQNGYFSNGYTGLKFNVANSSTIIDVENSTFIGEGEFNNTFNGRVTSSQDTRPIFEVTGSLGQFTSSANVYQNFSSGSFSAASLVDGGSMDLGYLTQNSAKISAVKITTTSTSSVATLQDFTGTQTGTSGLYNCTFVQGNDGHAMVISGSSFDFYGLKFQGYGNTTSDSASVYVSASTGTVTINLFNDGDTPTYKSDGATVNIVQSVQLRVSNAVSGSEVQLVSSSGADLDTVAGTNFQIDETTGRLPTQPSSNNFATYNYNYPGYDQQIYIIVHSLGYEYQLIEATLGSVGQTVRTSQVEDRNYDEGQTPFDPI